MASWAAFVRHFHTTNVRETARMAAHIALEEAIETHENLLIQMQNGEANQQQVVAAQEAVAQRTEEYNHRLGVYNEAAVHLDNAAQAFNPQHRINLKSPDDAHALRLLRGYRNTGTAIRYKYGAEVSDDEYNNITSVLQHHGLPTNCTRHQDTTVNGLQTHVSLGKRFA